MKYKHLMLILLIIADILSLTYLLTVPLEELDPYKTIPLMISFILGAFYIMDNWNDKIF